MGCVEVVRMGLFFLWWVVWCGGGLSAGMLPPGSLVINEIYYDHPGADGSFEFVEFYNADTVAVLLADVVLEFHNGTDDGWEEIWRGITGAVPPSGVVAVGGAGVRPPVQQVATFSLQNGPDALRVRVRGVETDRVGYGGLDDPEWVESEGVPAVAPGEAVARIRDGHDTNNNRADFAAALPSPGLRNVPDINASITPLSPSRQMRRSAGMETIWFRVGNGGTEAFISQSATVTLADSIGGGTTVRTDVRVDAIVPGGYADVRFDVHLVRGFHFLNARVTVPGDARAGDDVTALFRQVGSRGILVSEVHAAPAAGPAFIELFNAGPEPVVLAGFTLRDRIATPVAIAPSSPSLLPGGFLVITQDVEELLARYAAARAADVVTTAGAFPAFNRTGSPADSVLVADAYGIVVAAVAYPAPIPGRSLERVDLFDGEGDAVWIPSDDPTGATPGYSGRRVMYRPGSEGRTEVSPNPFYPDNGDVLRIVVTPDAETATVTSTVFSVAGQRVAALGNLSGFPAVFLWDARNGAGDEVPPGLYVVVAEWFGADGVRRRVDRVVVGRAGKLR